MMITKTLVPDKDRPDFLYAMLGRQHLRFELLTYSFMDTFCTGYQGGYWDFYRLGNGGLFIALDSAKTFGTVNPINGFEGNLSAEAAGIGACLFALNTLVGETHNSRYAELYHALHEFAIVQDEARAIAFLID